LTRHLNSFALLTLIAMRDSNVSFDPLRPRRAWLDRHNDFAKLLVALQKAVRLDDLVEREGPGDDRREGAGAQPSRTKAFAPCRPAGPHHPRWRQELRCGGLCQRTALHERHTACGGEGHRLGHRRRTTRHAGYALSQRIRKRIEEVFGWGKTVGPLAQSMLRGAERVARNLPSRWLATILPAAKIARRMTRRKQSR
jgi:hypothetical protein